jgi:hypothetical protein
MRLRIGIIAVLAVSLAGCEHGVTTISSLKKGKQDVDCSASYVTINMAGTFKCSQFDLEAADSGGGIFRTFNLMGTASDTTFVNIQARKALSSRGFYYNVYEKVSENIQGFNDTTSAAHDWTPVKSVANARIIRFVTADARSCVGFVSAGQPSSAGNGWKSFKRGYFCPGRNKSTFTDDQVGALVSGIEIRDTIPTPTSVSTPALSPPESSQAGVTSPAIASFAAKMKALKEAYEQGSISFDEYDAKRKALMNAM